LLLIKSIHPTTFKFPAPATFSFLDKFPRWAGVAWVTALDEPLVQVEADGNAIAGISAVKQIVSITVVVHVYVIAVVPIV